MGWGTFFDRVSGWIPIQKRKERWLNQIDKLEKEREKILNEKVTEKKSLRLVDINVAIALRQQWLRNASSGE